VAALRFFYTEAVNRHNLRKYARSSGCKLSERPRLPTGQSRQGSSPSHGFLPLDSIFPRMGITKQTIRKPEAIQMVREHRENRKQTIAFHAHPLVLCGLPLRKPSACQVIYTR